MWEGRGSGTHSLASLLGWVCILEGACELLLAGIFTGVECCPSVPPPTPVQMALNGNAAGVAAYSIELAVKGLVVGHTTLGPKQTIMYLGCRKPQPYRISLKPQP